MSSIETVLPRLIELLLIPLIDHLVCVEVAHQNYQTLLSVMRGAVVVDRESEHIPCQYI